MQRSEVQGLSSGLRVWSRGFSVEALGDVSRAKVWRGISR